MALSAAISGSILADFEASFVTKVAHDLTSKFPKPKSRLSR
jgi:hypothetical protein